MALEIHPAAEAFPMMDEKRFSELLNDIRQHGQREAITLCEGKILDGRNRYKACENIGIEPIIKNYDGDPWAFVWSLNGERRDLVAEQRYLIWKFCSEKSEAWAGEKRRIANDANRKRSEAAKEQPRTETGFAPKQVREHFVPAPDNAPRPGKQSKAAASKTNAGAVARGDLLTTKRPDLARAVMQGEIKPAEAHRQLKREEVKAKLQEISSKEIEQPTGKFDVIVIDPPWQMKKIDRDCRPNQVEFDYPTMTENELRKLEIPAAENCHIWLWTTNKNLPLAIELLDDWGARYVCTFVWHKPGGFQPIGLPQFNCEFILYARIGTPQFIDTKAFNTCFQAARGAHSEKPEEFYATLRRVTGGRRLDMFNRRKIDGFIGWGKEA